MVVFGAALAIGATPAIGQSPPARMKDWSAMFDRIDKVIGPYQTKLGLAHYWNTYCLDKTNDEDQARPKDGSLPFGIADWDALNQQDFERDLGIFEENRTAEMMLCLADVKARLNAAER